MITLKQAANRVASHGGKDREVFLDVATLMLICSILSTLFSAVRMWCEWKRGQKADGEQIQKICARPPMRIRRRVERHVLAQVGEDYYDQHGKQLVQAIFQAGAATSPADIEGLDYRLLGYTNQWGEQEREL